MSSIAKSLPLGSSLRSIQVFLAQNESVPIRDEEFLTKVTDEIKHAPKEAAKVLGQLYTEAIYSKKKKEHNVEVKNQYKAAALYVIIMAPITAALLYSEYACSLPAAPAKAPK